MQIFSCPDCGRSVFFDSSLCTGCGSRLAFFPGRLAFGLLDATRGVCRNYQEHGVCNWGLDPGDAGEYCRSCRLNTAIPNLADKGSWQRLEAAKRRLVFTLLELGLDPKGKEEDPSGGLSFAFLKDELAVGKPKVLTGHSAGLITINIAEAEDPHRERVRIEMGESYRTLLGHFRHESGHYYWNRLVCDAGRLSGFRELFGDERTDYTEAARRHYSLGPPVDWVASYLSAYASMHPWEDFAETWAHYLHLIDTLGTARAHGLSLKPRPSSGPAKGKGPATVLLREVDPGSFADLIGAWYPLTVTLNELSRSMGAPDPYPFVLPDKAVAKLRFVHTLVEQARDASHGAA